MRNLVVGILQPIIFFFFSLQGTRYLNFSRLILGKAFSLFLPWRRWMLLLFLFFFWGILPPSTLFLPSSRLFRVPVTAVPPCVFVNLFGFFPDMGLNVNLNAGQAESVTAYPHVQAQRASVCHLPPPPRCTFRFFRPPKRSTLALGPERAGDQRHLLHFVLRGEPCSRCLVKTLPLTTLLSKHTTVSPNSPQPSPQPLHSNAVLLQSALWRQEAAWHLKVGAGPKKTCYLCYLSLLLPPFFLPKAYTLNVWTEE